MLGPGDGHSSSDTSSAGGGDQWDIYTADAVDDLGVLVDDHGVYVPSLFAVNEESAGPAGAAGAAGAAEAVVGRCRLTLGWPQIDPGLTALGFSA